MRREQVARRRPCRARLGRGGRRIWRADGLDEGGAAHNAVAAGLKRRGVERSDISAMRAAYQALAQGEGSFLDRARRLAEETESDYVREMTDFILSATDRSFLTPK